MQGLSRLEPGSVFADDFRVVRRIARGGMGTVYLVEQLSTGRKRALKIMFAQTVDDGASRARFQQEAQVGARIESDNVVEVVAAGVDPGTGTPWLAMELLDGRDLAALVAADGPLDHATAREVMEQVGHALGAAHRVGVVHRDLKPENIFIAAPRRPGVPFTVKVLDFGVAKVLGEDVSGATTGAMGSPMWMSPEQARVEGRVKPATDVWALGLVAFWMLTGKYYWNATNAPSPAMMDLLREILVEPIEAASARAARLGSPRGLPPGFDAWFARCVARAPEERFRDGGAAVDALLPLLGGPVAPSAPPSAPPPSAPPTAPPRRPPPWAVALAVATGTVVAGAVALRLLMGF
jgi:serine/threonine protein kinase